MPARLVPLTSGPAPSIALDRPVILIGRHPDCDVPINLPEISRRHCCVAQASERLVIRDLGSRNGVRVNGHRVDEASLRPGDEVAIAHLIYRLDVAPDEVALAAPSRPPAATPAPPLQTPPSLPELPVDPDADPPPQAVLDLDL
ncbi:MAG TPA: FHA domain-containing protein [Isosphaeraceae bacterium]|jgi:predicted component of type VI protein secretion system